ncbi:hypothetical protein CISG_01280 [Coccidioides immitis RMSCC 3703]|uniref:Uncharacterized protein n=1 Tax=Coccidioides immitis RMSCC 3703 TaxID=454286 RepID=A0A0J8TS15_COCIT|nr:hypothetical protein CISG_01280 [Coccidioides immitis RMSCC 3703]
MGSVGLSERNYAMVKIQSKKRSSLPGFGLINPSPLDFDKTHIGTLEGGDNAWFVGGRLNASFQLR